MTVPNYVHQSTAIVKVIEHDKFSISNAALPTLRDIRFILQGILSFCYLASVNC